MTLYTEGMAQDISGSRTSNFFHGDCPVYPATDPSVSCDDRGLFMLASTASSRSRSRVKVEVVCTGRRTRGTSSVRSHCNTQTYVPSKSRKSEMHCMMLETCPISKSLFELFTRLMSVAVDPSLCSLGGYAPLLLFLLPRL